MTTKDTKSIHVEVSTDCWKKLKIISISKDMKLQDVIKEILEKSVAKKNVELQTHE